MKRSQEDLLEKLNSYELEVRKNARQIGEYEGELRNKNQLLIKTEERLRDLESEREALRSQATHSVDQLRREFEYQLR